MELIKVEQAGGTAHIWRAHVNAPVVSPRECITCHAWAQAGHLLLGTDAGALYLVPNAATQAGPPPQSWCNRGTLAAAQLFAADLATWSAGPVVHIAVTKEHMVLVLGGSATRGPLVLWLQDGAQPVVAHVKLPLATVTSCAQNADASRLALRSACGRTLVVTTKGDQSDTVEVAAQAHPAPVLAASAVPVRLPDGHFAVSVDAQGSLYTWLCKPDAKLAQGGTAPRVALLHRASLGVRAAAMAVHPSQPLVAVAGVNGAVQLLDASAIAAAALAGDTVKAQDAAQWMQYSAHALQPGHKQQMAWSPDGSTLAAMNRDSSTVTLLKRHVGHLQPRVSSLQRLGSFHVPNVNVMRWHIQTQSGTLWLVLHLAQGRILVLQPPMDVATTPDGMYAEDCIAGTRYRVAAPLVDMVVLEQQSNGDAVCVLGVASDRSVRRFMLPFHSAHGSKGGVISAGAAAATGPIIAEARQVCVQTYVQLCCFHK